MDLGMARACRWTTGAERRQRTATVVVDRLHGDAGRRPERPDERVLPNVMPSGW
jgi:hypothetical protein